MGCDRLKSLALLSFLGMTMQHIETDYLIIGSGASGMAFADTRR
jgi:hypothetical protein